MSEILYDAQGMHSASSPDPDALEVARDSPMYNGLVERPSTELSVRLHIPVSYQADRNPAMVYLARLSMGSRISVRGTLQVVADLLTGGSCTWETMPWHLLQPQHTKALRVALAERYAPSTANKMISVVRSVLREAWELGHMPAEQFHRAAAMRPVRGERLLRGRGLAAGELRALFAACQDDPSPAGARDAALLAVLYGSGLRRSEAVALDVAHYNKEDGSVTVLAGKGNKDRICYAASGEAEMLDAWLLVRGDAPGPLFCHVAKGGKVKIRRLSDKAVLYIVQRRAKMAGVAHLSPHDFRRSMIGDLLDAGADLSVVQRLAGHSQVGTTARYDRRGEATKRKAAKLLHIPARRD